MFSKLVTYLKESRIELKKVQWPTRQETMKLTWIVIAISLATAAFLGFIDFLLNKVLELII